MSPREIHRVPEGKQFEFGLPAVTSISKKRLSAPNRPPSLTRRPPPETRVNSHLPGIPAS